MQALAHDAPSTPSTSSIYASFVEVSPTKISESTDSFSVRIPPTLIANALEVDVATLMPMSVSAINSRLSSHHFHTAFSCTKTKDLVSFEANAWMRWDVCLIWFCTFSLVHLQFTLEHPIFWKFVFLFRVTCCKVRTFLRRDHDSLLLLTYQSNVRHGYDDIVSKFVSSCVNIFRSWAQERTAVRLWARAQRLFAGKFSEYKRE